jgi:outer membrane lipoprotein carrier protein
MRMLMAVAIALVALAGVQPQTPSAPELTASLQARYDNVKSFAADFTQTYRVTAVPQQDVNHGTVKIRKPGRMIWIVTSPTRQQLVSDGTFLTSWTGGVQADRTKLPTDSPSTGLMLLSGRGNLVRDFTPALPAPQPASEWQLVLTPKTPQTDFATLTLFVDRQTLRLNGYEQVGRDGARSTVRFTNLKENIDLPDSLFVFKPPSGVVVIDR